MEYVIYRILQTVCPQICKICVGDAKIWNEIPEEERKCDTTIISHQLLNRWRAAFFLENWTLTLKTIQNKVKKVNARKTFDGKKWIKWHRTRKWNVLHKVVSSVQYHKWIYVTEALDVFLWSLYSQNFYVAAIRRNVIYGFYLLKVALICFWNQVSK